MMEQRVRDVMKHEINPLCDFIGLTTEEQEIEQETYYETVVCHPENLG